MPVLVEAGAGTEFRENHRHTEPLAKKEETGQEDCRPRRFVGLRRAVEEPVDMRRMVHGCGCDSAKQVLIGDRVGGIDGGKIRRRSGHDEIVERAREPQRQGIVTHPGRIAPVGQTGVDGAVRQASFGDQTAKGRRERRPQLFTGLCLIQKCGGDVVG